MRNAACLELAKQAQEFGSGQSSWEGFVNLPINITEVLSGRLVERERLEFKEGWNPEAVLHTICAFANDFHNLGGAYIFVGIAAEEGRLMLTPSGLDPNGFDAIQQELLHMGFDRMLSAYHPICTPYESEPLK